MKFVLLALVFVSLIAVSPGQPYTCSGVQIISPTTNISIPWYFPSNWTTDQDAPQYASGLNCTWKFNVPKGMFAYFSMKAKTNQSALLQMTDSTGYVSTFTSAAGEPFFLMDPSFTVSLVSRGVGSMGIFVQWHTVTPTFPTTIRVTAKGSPLAAFSGDFDNGTIIQSDTQVSLLSIAPGATQADFIYFLRATQIFDGPSINSTLLGNLYQVMATGRNLVSSGKWLTLYSVFPGLAPLGNVVVLQDYSDVKQFKQYSAVWCPLPNVCQLSLDAQNGTAAALRYSPYPFFVKYLGLAQNNKLSVYTDSVSDAHWLVDYTANSAKTDVPQKFRSSFTTFVLNQGQATVQFTSDRLDAQWSVPFEGRRGFFASPNYALSSGAQNFTDQISGSQAFNISYTVNSAVIKGAANLKVTIMNGQSTVVGNVYSATNFPGGTVWAKGTNIAVEYVPNGDISTGAIVRFGFDKYNVASSLNFFGTLVVALWVALSI